MRELDIVVRGYFYRDISAIVLSWCYVFYIKKWLSSTIDPCCNDAMRFVDLIVIVEADPYQGICMPWRVAVSHIYGSTIMKTAYWYERIVETCEIVDVNAIMETAFPVRPIDMNTIIETREIVDVNAIMENVLAVILKDMNAIVETSEIVGVNGGCLLPWDLLIWTQSWKSARSSMWTKSWSDHCQGDASRCWEVQLSILSCKAITRTPVFTCEV